MYKIVEKRLLAPEIWLMKVDAPRVALSAQPGQFVIVKATDKGERIPLTIADYDRKQGWVAIVVQAVGLSTKKIAALGEGDSLKDFAGPLGKASEFIEEPVEEVRRKKILFVGGGVGAAPVYPQVKWMHDNGAEVDVIVGARSKEFLIMTGEMAGVAANLYLATDDGSAGFHGNVTACMRDLIDNQGKRYDEVVTIGPMVMMKFVALATKEYGIRTIASLNTIMIDGTGMCGACRVSVGGKTQFTCVDGPEFDAHEVDFDEAMRRQDMYKSQEERLKAKAAEFEAGHKCNIGLDSNFSK